MRSGLDMPFFFINMAILVVGLVMMFSASYPNAYYYKNGDSYYFIRSQLIWAVIGVVAMIAVSYFDYHHFHKFAVPILGIPMKLFSVMQLPALKESRATMCFFRLGPMNMESKLKKKQQLLE